MVLRLRRKYQVLSGTARLGWQEVPLIAPTLDGSTLSFTLHDFHGDGVTRFTGRLRGPYLRGICSARDSERSVPWGGVRR